MDPVKLTDSALVSKDLFHLRPGTIALQVIPGQWQSLTDVYFTNYRCCAWGTFPSLWSRVP
jgi:hypothetical protein